MTDRRVLVFGRASHWRRGGSPAGPRFPPLEAGSVALLARRMGSSPYWRYPASDCARPVANTPCCTAGSNACD
jgi:hypothetical protein